MISSRRSWRAGAPCGALCALALLVGCGGGGGSSSPPPAQPAAAANSLPVVGAIDNVVVAVGERVSVAVSITDDDASDTHVLAARSDADCVAAVTVDDATLGIAGLVAGETTITVTARDGVGAGRTSAPVSFLVSVLPPTAPDWALPRAAPADASVEPCPVGAVLDYLFTDSATQSALLLRQGQVIGERYAEGHGVGSLGTSWSVAKSFYSAAIGVAVDDGAIASLDQRASDFLTEWIGTDKESVTVRNLLEMRGGLPDAGIFFERDQTAFALGQPRVSEPGTTFLYSNPTSQLFEPLIRRATGSDAHTFLAERILHPIGIDTDAVGLWTDPDGSTPLTYCCIDMRPDDFARFGLLYLNGGVWNGEQVVSADYVAESLDARSPFYGHQWWVLNEAYLGQPPPIDVSAAIGIHGQHIYLWPEGDVVVVVLTEYIHDAEQGYVLHLPDNWPNTCAARGNCPDSAGPVVESYSRYELLGLLAEVRP